MTKKIGLYTGTFDTVTNGHLDIIYRAAKLFDTLYVGIFKRIPCFQLLNEKSCWKTYCLILIMFK